MNTYQKLKRHLPFFGIIILLNLASTLPTYGTEGEKSRSGGGIISSTEKTNKDALASFLVSNTTWSTEKHLGFEANGAMVSGTTSGTSTGSTGGTATGSTGGGSGATSCAPASGTIQLSVTISVVAPSCDGNLNRQLTALASDGSSPYTYTWDNSANTAARNVTASGTFRVTVTDAIGCTAVASKTLGNNLPTTSSITATACGSYSWTQNNQIYTSSGSYNDTIINNDGCDSIITLNLTINPLPAAFISQGDTVSVCVPDSIILELTGRTDKYRWYRGSNVAWVEVDSSISTPNFTFNHSFAIAPNGTPYLGIIDRSNSEKINVYMYNGSSWQIVGAAGFSAGAIEFQLTIGANGQPYVAYRARSTGATIVMQYDGTNWIAIGGDASDGNSLVQDIKVDDNGTPYVAYQDVTTSNRMSVKKYDGTNWITVGSLGFTPSSIDDLSLAISGNGMPTVAFRNIVNSSKTAVLQYNGSSWVNLGSTGFSDGTAGDQKLVFAPNGTAYVAYKDVQNNNKCTVMKYDGSSWVLVGSKAFSPSSINQLDLNIDADGIPYVTFLDNTVANKVTVMKFNSQNWELVGSAGISDGNAAIPQVAVDLHGTPFVAYRDDANNQTITVKHFPKKQVSTQASVKVGALDNFYVELIDSLGCSSSDTITVIDRGITTVNQFDTANGSYTWSRTGITYDTSGIYTFTKMDSTTCDSLFQLYLTIEGPLIATISDTACSSYLWAQNGMTYTSSGNYSDTVQNNSGADSLVITLNLTINDAPLITISSQTDISCNNGTDGSFTAMSNGGTGRVTYQWSNGDTSATAFNLGTGVYTVTATDANGCTASLTDTITEPTALGNTLSSFRNVSCNGAADGFINFAERGGTSPYKYLWSNGDSTANITGLTAGVYTISVTDANNCGPTTRTITIGQPSALSMRIVFQKNVSCNSGGDGRLRALASGGTGGATYLWSNGETSHTADNLSAGVYSVTATDGNGCTATLTDTITEPIAVSVSIASKTDVSCNGGADGSFTAMASGGTGRVTYQWSNGDTSATAFNLGAAVYTVTATDANGCTATLTDTITEPIAVSVSIASKTDVSCNGGTDGSFTAMTSGGTGGVNYLWSNGDTSATAFNLSAGVYTVTATDRNGCTATKTDTITEPTAVSVSITSQTDVSCNGGTDGSFTAMTSGGTGGVNYLWSNGDTSATAFNLSAGVYSVTATDANGCTATLTDTIAEPILITGTKTETACDSFSWSINSMVYTQTGTYVGTATAANGCDSIVTLNLTVINSTSETFSADVCNSYDWQGMTFAQTGTYFDTIPNAAGCDSLMTLNLIIRNETSETFTADVCNSYDWQGMTFTTTGTYFDTIPNAAGCDSLMTLNLIIRNETSETFTADVCNSYTWQGMTFTQTGTYYDTIPNAAGCDSLMTLNLIIRNETSETFSADVCNSYDWQGMTFTTTGTYFDTIPNAAGCDSLMTLNLIIRNETSETFSADVCNSYDWQGMTFTTTGTYFDTIPNAAGCDSLMTLNLIIRNETSETFSADVCNTYDWQGMTFSQTGTYFDTIPNAAGCDSLMTLNLIIRTSTSSVTNANECNLYTWQGMTFSQTGTYFDTIPNAAGCDSLMTLNLIIRNETSETFSADVCNTYDWQGMTFTQTGTYFDTIPNAAGCDSLMTLNLIIRTSTSSVTNANECNLYTWQGMTFTQTGTYFDTILNAAGCDSLMTLNLIIRNETSETFTADVCNSYDWQGMTFTQTGTYFDTIPNAAGCDSLMTLNLIIRNETSETFSADVCNSYDWQGMTFTTTGTYFDTILNAAGCDSLMTLNLVVNYTVRDTLSITVCDTYTWLSNGVTYTSSGIYSDTLTGAASNGCDSIATIDLTLDQIVTAEAGVDQQFCEEYETTLNATAQSAGSGRWNVILGGGTFIDPTNASTDVNAMQLGTNSFEWVVSNGTCPTESDTVNVVVDENPIADAGPDLATRDIEPVQIQASATNAQTINWTPFSTLVDETVEQPIANPQENTVYRMDVTSPEGCTAFDEMEITVTIETNLDATTLFSPNGDGMNDNWIVNKPALIQGCRLIIVDRNGTEVFSTTSYNNDWDATINGSELPEGTYYYVIDCPDGREFNGPISVIREKR